MIYSTLIWVLFLSLVIFIFKDQIRSILESIARIGNKTSNIQYKGVNIALGGEVSSMTVGQQDTPSSTIFTAAPLCNPMQGNLRYVFE